MHRLSPPDFEQARQLLQTLIERGVRHPIPIAWLANWHVLRVQQGWSEDRRRDAYLALDAPSGRSTSIPTCSLALAIDGFVHTNLLKRLDIAEERYELALAANPNNALAWLLKGTLHAFKGEGAQAVERTQRALAALAARPAPLLLRFARRHRVPSRPVNTSARSSWRSDRCAPTARTPRPCASMAVAQWQLGRPTRRADRPGAAEARADADGQRLAGALAGAPYKIGKDGGRCAAKRRVYRTEVVDEHNGRGHDDE